MAFRTTPVLRTAMRRWVYKLSGWNQYGLYRDDVLYDEDPDVAEALRRLPRHVVDERNFRLIRAMQLSINKKVMPKEKWVSYEDDKANEYLYPIVQEVIKERKEREKWESEY